MKQNTNETTQQQDHFAVLSFASSPNQSFQFSTYQKQQTHAQQSYCLIISFVILGFYFLVFGIIQLSTNFNEIKYKIQLNRYGKQYSSQNTFLTFKQNTSVLIYLSLEDMTQFDSQCQLNQLHYQCKNYKTNQQMHKTNSILNTPLDPKQIAFPCGKHAYFYPQGTFSIINSANNHTLQITTNDISMPDQHSNVQDKSPQKQWAKLSSQRFKNWMTINAHQKIQKLWGRITSPLSGNYQIKLTVNNQIPQINKFYITLNNNEALSGYNNELCYLNFFYALLVFLAALISFLIQRKWGHRKVLKKKLGTNGQATQIKLFLNSPAQTPAVKFD